MLRRIAGGSEKKTEDKATTKPAAAEKTIPLKGDDENAGSDDFKEFNG